MAAKGFVFVAADKLLGIFCIVVVKGFVVVCAIAVVVAAAVDVMGGLTELCVVFGEIVVDIEAGFVALVAGVVAKVFAIFVGICGFVVTASVIFAEDSVLVTACGLAIEAVSVVTAVVG